VSWQNFTASDWVTFYLLLLALQAAYALPQAFVGSWVGLAIEEISLGFGPRIAGWRVMGTDWQFRPLPLGSWVKFAGDDPARPPALGVRNFQDLRFGPAALLLSSGPAAMAVLGAALAGTQGPPSVRLPGAIGVYVAVLNLLPIPALNGGLLLMKGIESARGRLIAERTRTAWTMAGLAVSLTVMIGLIYGVVAHPDAVMNFRFPFSAAEGQP
jgi:membrane-associated protease RseP (regulator of RpoE activity)